MTDPDELTQEIYLIADELRGAATLTRHYSRDLYELERAEQIMHLAARLAALVDPAPLAMVTELFDDEAWSRVSPAVGVEAVVLDPAGRVLLCQRRDNQHWCLPGGLAEIGQPITDAALRELWEEAGLRGEITRLLGVFDGPRWGTRSKVHLIQAVFEVSCTDLAASPGTEMITAGYFAPDNLPAPLHPGHGERIPVCLDMITTGRTHHDPASSLTGDLPMLQRPEPGRPRRP